MKKVFREIIVPLSVPARYHHDYVEHYQAITSGSGRLLLFAGDQKIEHLNDDFYGPDIDLANQHPEHLFRIAASADVGVFAAQMGLIARYAHAYKTIRYLVKINAKTNLCPTSCADPQSLALQSVDQVLEFEQSSGLTVAGFGYTIYLGSAFEHIMLAQASALIYQAHRHGKLVVLWMYPRGASVKDEKNASLIAGAAGVGTALGADFVKVNVPEGRDAFDQAQQLQQAVSAAGNTGVLCSGGGKVSSVQLLEHVYHQIHTGGVAGVALGRNIHQRSLDQACTLIKALNLLLHEDEDLEVVRNMITFE